MAAAMAEARELPAGNDDGAVAGDRELPPLQPVIRGIAEKVRHLDRDEMEMAAA